MAEEKLNGGPHHLAEHVYRSDPGINISSLKHMRDSPAKARRRIDYPRAPSPAMAAGTAIHMAILEPERMLDCYAVRPEVDARTKAGKEALAAANAGGKTLLPKDELESYIALGVRLRSDPFYRRFLDGGLAETSWFANHNYGARLKGRLDMWLPEKNVIVDIKTTDSADERGFLRDAIKYGYHSQAAYYMDLVTLVTGVPVSGYVILAVEKTEDKDCRAFWLDDELLTRGRSDYRKWLAQWIVCEQRGEWPGYPQEIVTLNAPKWLKDDTTF